MRQADFSKSIWDRIRVLVQCKRACIEREIGCYPAPISGCDAQFNHLLKQQTELTRKCSRLTKTDEESLTATDPIQVIDQVLQSSDHIDPEEKKVIRTSLTQETFQYQRSEEIPLGNDES